MAEVTLACATRILLQLPWEKMVCLLMALPRELIWWSVFNGPSLNGPPPPPHVVVYDAGLVLHLILSAASQLGFNLAVAGVKVGFPSYTASINSLRGKPMAGALLPSISIRHQFCAAGVHLPVDVPLNC